MRAMILLGTILFLFSSSWAFIDAVDLVHGDGFACAITKSNNLSCWGNNSTVLNNIPVLNEVTQVAAFSNHACALSHGRVFCWGDNSNMQTQVPTNLSNVVAIAVGDKYSCAATTSVVTCWGKKHPQFGKLFDQRFRSIRKISVEPNRATVFEGYVHLCLLDGRTLFCFSSIAADEIAVPKDLGVVKDFKVGMRHACGSTDSGWRCWGDGSYFENIFRWPEFELGDFDSKIYDHHEYCFMQNGRPACNNGHTPSGDLIGVRKVVIGPTHGDACALTVEGVRCWGNSYGSPLQVPIPTELQNISPRLNTEALNNFLGCYSRGFTLLKKISARQTYPDGGRIEQVELNQLVDVFAATDDIIKVLPGKEAIVISDTEKIYSSNGGFSPPHQALRVYQKDDGTFAISSPHGVVQGLKRENCPR